MLNIRECVDSLWVFYSNIVDIRWLLCIFYSQPCLLFLKMSLFFEVYGKDIKIPGLNATPVWQI